MYTVLRKGCHARHPQVFSLSREEGLDHYVLLLVLSPGLTNSSAMRLPDRGSLFPAV